MANIIDQQLFDRMYAMAFVAFRRKLSIIKACTRYDIEGDRTRAYGQGSSVIVPIPALFGDDTVEDVVPGPTPPVGPDIELRYCNVMLDNYKKVSYHFTDQELMYLQKGTMSSQMSAAIEALAGAIAKSVWQNHLSINTILGTPGNPLFETNTTLLQQCYAILSDNGVPQENRHLVLSPFAYGNALGLDIFRQYLQYGGTEVLREALLPRVLGFDWHEDSYLPSFTTGNLSTTSLKSVGTFSAGVKTLTLDATTLTGSVVKGDTLTIGDYAYVITGNASALSNSITVNIEPSLVITIADNTDVEVYQESYDVGAIAMHSSAIVFASRRTDSVYPGGSMISNLFDVNSGLSLCLEITRQYKRTNVEFSCLWGSNIARRDAIIKLVN